MANGLPARHYNGAKLDFPISFLALRERHKIEARTNTDRVALRYDELVTLIRSILEGISVDEPWYLATYRDVAQAIEAGQFSSAKHHFVMDGYFEGRLPYKIAVDEDWYLNAYPDVLESILNQSFQSAEEHFEKFGYGEGRLPAAPEPD